MGQPIGLFVEAIGGDEDEAWRQNNKEVLTLMATSNTPSMSVDQQCYNTHFVLFNSIIAWCAISGVWCYIWSLVLYLVFYICRETDASYSSIQQPQKPLHSFTKTLKGSKILLVKQDSGWELHPSRSRSKMQRGYALPSPPCKKTRSSKLG